MAIDVECEDEDKDKEESPFIFIIGGWDHDWEDMFELKSARG